MPSPREIAKQKNPAANFGNEADSYDAEMGYAPTSGLPGKGTPKDHEAANPTNPPEGAVEGKNLKGG